MGEKPKRALKLVLILLGGVSFLCSIALFWQVHTLHKEFKSQITDLNSLITAANAQVLNLQINASQLNNSLKNIQASQANLKHLQALNASMALTILQQDLLQGVAKNILLNNFNNLQSLITEIHSAQVSTAFNQLQNAVENLPNINPANAIAQLNTLQPMLANLSFVEAAPTPTSSATPISSHGIKGTLLVIWQQIKSLIIVRSDNTISAQLVSDAARFDALRQLTLLIQEAEWQIVTSQDPSATLTQLKIAVTAYTQPNQAQAAWLTQLNQIQTSDNYYTNTQLHAVLSAINNLQQALSLQ